MRNPMENRFAMNAVRMHCLVFLMGALCSQAVDAQEVPPVNVKVSAQPMGSATVYHYRIINHGAQPITALQIGFDYHGESELQKAPSGSEPGSLPPAAVASPQGWTAELNATEDSPNLDLEWSANTADGAIPPGGSLSGFSVTVPGNDMSYMNSHWTVSLNGTGAAAYSATLDTERFCCPPRLSIAATPDVLWPPNHQMFPVKIAVSVQDDVDPHPMLTLVSVDSNQAANPHDISAAIGSSTTDIGLAGARTGKDKAGRIYTITYQAKNVCGAAVQASTTVAVPHDQRR
jgi:hypothetical protein